MDDRQIAAKAQFDMREPNSDGSGGAEPRGAVALLASRPRRPSAEWSGIEA
jgi:hypothetical protein